MNRVEKKYVTRKPWRTILTWILGTPTLLAIGMCLPSIYRYLKDPPIFVDNFVIAGSAVNSGLTAEALTDHLKAQFSEINQDASNLFEVRKLSDTNTPLDVKIGDTGMSLVALLKSFGMRFTAADITGRISQIGNTLTLHLTMSQEVPVHVETYVILLPSGDARRRKEVFLDEVNKALDCFAINAMVALSPDVAANYLHTVEPDEAISNARRPDTSVRCKHPDDVELYNSVQMNPAETAAARVNALVGLSVHYAEEREYREEVAMSEAATELAARLMPCEDRRALSAWRGLTCTLLRQRNDLNRRAYVAAWMQRGVAYSDYAGVADDETQERQRAVDAYKHLLIYAGDDPRNYAQAREALGTQITLLQTDDDPLLAYGDLPGENQKAAAYLDRGLAWIHGRRDSYVRLKIGSTRLQKAETDFIKAISIDPNYWDAHARLGYVLFEEGRSEKDGLQVGKLRDATDALEVALAHDQSNRPLRRLLASVDADLCRFDTARKMYRQAYAADRDARDEMARHEAERIFVERGANDIAATGTIETTISPRTIAPRQPMPYGLDILADWGKVLDGFGFHDAAIEQENEVLRQDPKSVEALMFLGQLKIKYRNLDPGFAQEGLNALSQALKFGADESTTVIAAYLMGLLQTGKEDVVAALYPSLAKASRVPTPLSLRQANARSMATDQRLQVIYAKALDKSKEAAKAPAQWTALHQIGLRDDIEIADFITQSRGIVGDEDESTEQPRQHCSAWLTNQAPRLADVAITD